MVVGRGQRGNGETATQQGRRFLLLPEERARRHQRDNHRGEGGSERQTTVAIRDDAGRGGERDGYQWPAPDAVQRRLRPFVCGAYRGCEFDGRERLPCWNAQLRSCAAK